MLLVQLMVVGLLLLLMVVLLFVVVRVMLLLLVVVVLLLVVVVLVVLLVSVLQNICYYKNGSHYWAGELIWSFQKLNREEWGLSIYLRL